MARAVIKLPSDISSYMPFLSEQIKGCAYNPGIGQIAFRRDHIAVVIYPKEINIYKIENEAAARNVMYWLKTILDNKDESLIEDK